MADEWGDPMVGAFEPFGQAPDEAAKLRARIEVLEAALRPFVEGGYLKDERDTDHADAVVEVTAGDLRRADAALKEK